MKLPIELFQSPLVLQADFEACKLLSGGDATAAQKMLAAHSDMALGKTLIQRIATISGVTEEDIIIQFSRPQCAPIISVDAIKICREPVFIVDNIPMLVVHHAKFGVITVITPVAMLDKTAAPETLRKIYGAIRVHTLVVPLKGFEHVYLKMSEDGRIKPQPIAPLSTPAAYWKVIRELGVVSVDMPETLVAAIQIVRQTTRAATDPLKILVGCAIAHPSPLIDINTGTVTDRMSHFTPAVQKANLMIPVSVLGGKVCTIACPRAPHHNDRSLLSNYEERFCFVLASQDQINHAITEWESSNVSAHGIAQKIEIDTSVGAEIRVEEIDIESLAGQSDGESPTVVDLVQSMLLYAVRNNATDIHISQQPENMMIRFRIDGFLSLYPKPISAHLTKTVVARIKVLADIDTQFSPIPQDGKFAMRVRDKEFDVRVATTLTGYGEKAVLRLLPKEKTLPTLAGLGFRKREQEVVVRAIEADHGMLIICGPTGSGKSTTMAAGIGMIDCQRYAVVSGEQPIERQIPSIDQTNVTATPTNPDGLTFGRFVEAAMRQDPDYIIIGETRDAETAKQAVRAALTGHLVMTTLHTNSAASAPARLIDLGVEPILLEESLKSIVAQRLLPKLCLECIFAVPPPTDEVLENIGMKKEWFEGNANFMSAHGCPVCRGTKYSGRVAIVEGLMTNPRFRHIITKEHGNAELLREEMVRQNGKTLYMQAALLAATGVTDLIMATGIRSED